MAPIPPVSTDKYYGYNRFASGKKMYSTSVSGTVCGPIMEAFDLIRDWSEKSTFWTMTFDSASPTTAIGQDNLVGDTRHLTQNGNTYSEVLLYVDKGTYRLVYGLTASSVPAIFSAVTTIDLDPVPGDASKFTFTMGSNFQPAFPYPSLVSTIKAAQEAAYKGIITAMKKCFSPEIGMLTVSVLTGIMKDSSPNYMALRMSQGKPEIISTSGNGSPKSSKDLCFEIHDIEEQLLISIYDDNLIFSDTVLATGFVPTKDLGDEEEVEVSMKNDQGKVVGKYTLSITIDMYESQPVDKEAAIGSLALLVFEDFKQKFVEIAVNAAGKDPLAADIWEYGSYAKDLGPLPKFCKVLPARAIIMPKRTGELMQRNTEYLYSQLPLLGLQPTLAKLMADPKSVSPEVAAQVLKQGKDLISDPYMLPFRMWMPAPEKVIENLKTSVETFDKELAAQLIRGVNPMKITLISCVDEIAEELRCLKDDRGRVVEEMAADKSLFYCDYPELMVGKYNETKGCYYNRASVPGGLGVAATTYWYAPKLVCYKREDGTLDILGFTLTRFTDSPNTVYDKTTPPNLYKLAKMHLTCADNQHHQFISHLGFAHLAMEGFAVANNNAFPPGPDRHAIGKLLDPHFDDTIGINFLARQTLVSTVAPFTDTTFSPGTTNAMKIFSAAYQEWDFLGGNFPNDLKRRGFTEDCTDGLSGYHYRDDGFKVWNAYKTHFGRIVCRLYCDDAAVAEDCALKGWADEIRDPARGDIASFPSEIETREKLVECLTSIAFYCSGQHAAVNFSQLRYVAYVPNRPDSMRTPMPDTRVGEIAADRIITALPSSFNTEFQALFSYLLSTPPDNPMDTYNVTMKDFPLETKAFLADLKNIHAEIVFRNEALEKSGDIPYEYLDPMLIPLSINI